MNEQESLFERVAKRSAEIVLGGQATSIAERNAVALERIAAALEDQARAQWCSAFLQLDSWNAIEYGRVREAVVWGAARLALNGCHAPQAAGENG